MNLNREKHTISIMIGMYCRHYHSSNGMFCEECNHLNAYALKRVECCKFGKDKPVCAKCTIHCYKSDMREKIREVMRFSGPRMLFSHPVLALRHIIDSWCSR